MLCVLGSWEKDEIDEWKTYVKARAYENACFVAAANRVGEDVTLNFGGESMVIGPRGKIHAHIPGEEAAAPPKDEKKDDDRKDDDKDTAKKEEPKGKKKAAFLEGYAVARIDLDEIRSHREQRQTLQTRQPTSYRALVRRY
jgi:predicted amidohydrolase